jgi:acetyltransferase-like isoleucine patch superfamily enzyme
MGDDSSAPVVDPERALIEFVRDPAGARVIALPIDSPARPNPYCKCHESLVARLLFFAKAAVLEAMLRQPFNAPKVWLMRRMGMKVGQNVYVSVRTWIDPTYPELVTIEDDVMIGMEARIMTHEYRQKEYRAGTVRIGKGSLIGAFAIIGPGVDVGAGATVAAGSVVGKDVPAGVTVAGNPARAVMGLQR